MKNWREEKIKTADPSKFPNHFKKIANCPKSLRFRGRWTEEIFSKSLAIVGSRKMSNYGRMVVDRLMPELVAQNVTVISGFMYGVDGYAHEKCLECGGITVAVLGGGLNVLTPSEHNKLYGQILAKKGLVLSEYEDDFKPTLWSFPQRNRIVAGLSSMGVLVVEADMGSGSLVTASIAIKQGKNVMAVPGQITSSLANGTNWLLKSGLAKMVTDSSDIFGKINPPDQQIMFETRDPVEMMIVDLLKIEGLSIDEICNKNRLNAAEVSSALSMMLLSGVIINENGKYYLKNGNAK